MQKQHMLVIFCAVLLSSCGAEDEMRVNQAQVERQPSGEYQLSWDLRGKPVDVYVADTPDAPRQALRLVVDDSVAGTAAVTYQNSERPYFYVTPDKGKGVWTAERLLPLEGGVNFRDLGGYATADGRRTKWGKVYRSGNMGELTLSDYNYLDKIGIKVVCDFRSTKEREGEPNQWVKARDISYWARDYGMGFGDMEGLLTAPDATPEKMKAVILEGYSRVHIEQAPAFREMFKKLAGGEVPLAFNCSAGKDRTGGAAALILSALGVPRETVVSDYILSNKYYLSRPRKRMNSAYSFMEKLPRDLIEPLFMVNPDYINAMFIAIDKDHGSVEGYMKTTLGLTDKEIHDIRTQLLD